MDMSSVLELVGDASYFAAALLFILGLKRMASPVTARDGIVWAGVGMLIAVLATLIQPDMHNRGLMLVGIGIGASLAWVSGKRVAMTDMPQMVALYNGMGGGAAAAIGAVELLRFAAQMAAAAHPDAAVAADAAAGAGAHASHITQLILGSTGSLIGAISFSGSLIAFAKLQGWMDRRFVFPGQQYFNASVFALAIALGVAIVMVLNQPAVGPAGIADAHVDVAGALALNQTLIVGFFIAALAVGVLMTLPIGGADMPVVISLYNALTGLAVAFEGFVLQNETLIIAGTVVGAAGTLLTQLMAKAMNRSLASVLFSNFGASGEAQAISGAQKPIEAGDVAAMMAYAERVVIVPGYGMAVAQAQHKIWELTQLLIKRGVKVKFAIHPVAGRMPGHMNVLLAEAGVSYDLIADMDDINPEFPNTDVALVIGANDVVNPAAKTDPASPIYGMPILDVVAAKNAIVIKRGKGTGFAGIENALFYADNTRMLYGDGAEMANRLVAELKAVDGGH